LEDREIFHITRSLKSYLYRSIRNSVILIWGTGNGKCDRKWDKYPTWTMQKGIFVVGSVVSELKCRFLLSRQRFNIGRETASPP
jgi:hypothetical protein